MQKRYWLRGGVISLLIFFVLLIDSLFTGLFGFTGFWLFLKWTTEAGGGVSILIAPIIFVFIGSVVGLIYGKIKNRNQVQ